LEILEEQKQAQRQRPVYTTREEEIKAQELNAEEEFKEFRVNRLQEQIRERANE
jgi:hypothetical protein